jgi:hypothetical protein
MGLQQVWRISCLALVLGGAAVAGLHAQQLTPVPRVLWFSGVFQPADQQPVAPVETVTVRVYREREGGEALWSESHHVTMEANGHYSLLLGSTVADGVPLTLFTSGEPRWIGISVNRPGETEQPRVHMASVPYALKAADADTLGGLPASAFALAESASSPLTPTASRPASTSSAGVISPLASGTPGYLGKFVDSTTLDNSALFQSAGRIGLGTTAPLDGVHVAVNDGTGTLTGFAVQNLSGAANAYSGMLFYDQGGVLAQFQGFNNTTHEYRINNIASNGTINFRIGGTSRFLVANSGNIGLGVPIPTSKLDVAGDINLTGTLKMTGSTVLRLGTNSVGLGFTAMAANTTGEHNTALGVFALRFNTGGSYNTAVGSNALRDMNGTVFTTIGSYNTGIGVGALQGIVTGSNNTAVGYAAGNSITNTAASNNIMIGSAGEASDDAVIRIGTPGIQSTFYAAGVRGVTTNAADAIPVVISSSGQLGTVSSSRRFKEDIQDMGDASRGLLRLRPVTFRYIQPFGDGAKPIQYGLIAEEVAEVYPDLVARSADGQIETVKYQVLDVLLLNEVQRQQTEIRSLQAEIRAVIAQSRAVVQQNADLQQRLAALEAALGRR